MPGPARSWCRARSSRSRCRRRQCALRAWSRQFRSSRDWRRRSASAGGGTGTAGVLAAPCADRRCRRRGAGSANAASGPPEPLRMRPRIRPAAAGSRRGPHRHHPARPGCRRGRCAAQPPVVRARARPAPSPARTREPRPSPAPAPRPRPPRRRQCAAFDHSVSSGECAGARAGYVARPLSASRRRPHPRPSPPAASAGGGYAVQVSSQRSEAEAQAAFRALQAKFPSQLGGRSRSSAAPISAPKASITAPWSAPLPRRNRLPGCAAA